MASKEYKWPLEAKNDSPPKSMASKEMGPQSYKHLEINSANNMNDQENNFSPKAPERN